MTDFDLDTRLRYSHSWKVIELLTHVHTCDYIVTLSIVATQMTMFA